MIYDMTLIGLMYEKGQHADDMGWPSAYVSILNIDRWTNLANPLDERSLQ
jgi:hypothetical protein